MSISATVLKTLDDRVSFATDITQLIDDVAQVTNDIIEGKCIKAIEDMGDVIEDGRSILADSKDLIEDIVNVVCTKDVNDEKLETASVSN